MTIATVLDRSPLSPYQTEWRSLRTRHQNVLIEGPAAAAAAVLVLLQPQVLDPIVWKRPGAPLELGTGGSGGLIVEDVGMLSADEQSQLLAWLECAESRTQVISTTEDALFPLVARGLFDRGLYYRLNTMLLQVGLSGFPLSPQDAEAEPSSDSAPTSASPA